MKYVVTYCGLMQTNIPPNIAQLPDPLLNGDDPKQYEVAYQPSNILTIRFK